MNVKTVIISHRSNVRVKEMLPFLALLIIASRYDSRHASRLLYFHCMVEENIAFPVLRSTAGRRENNMVVRTRGVVWIASCNAAKPIVILHGSLFQLWMWCRTDNGFRIRGG